MTIKVRLYGDMRFFSSGKGQYMYMPYIAPFRSTYNCVEFLGNINSKCRQGMLR